MESYYFCFKNEKVNEKKIMMLQKESCIVKSHDVYIDADYADWIAEVKHRYRSAQVKAAVKVNVLYTRDDAILQQVGAELQRIEEQHKLKLYQVGKEIADEKLYQTGKGISTPMGVATYNNIKIKDALPSQELLAERIRLLQKELQETKRLMNKNK